MWRVASLDLFDGNICRIGKRVLRHLVGQEARGAGTDGPVVASYGVVAVGSDVSVAARFRHRG